MTKLNLKANTPAEQEILEYLENNASETLAEKINNGTPFEKDNKVCFLRISADFGLTKNPN